MMPSMLFLRIVSTWCKQCKPHIIITIIWQKIYVKKEKIFFFGKWPKSTLFPFALFIDNIVSKTEILCTKLFHNLQTSFPSLSLTLFSSSSMSATPCAGWVRISFTLSIVILSSLSTCGKGNKVLPLMSPLIWKTAVASSCTWSPSIVLPRSKDQGLYNLLLDVIRDTMRVFEHVGLVAKNGDKDLDREKRRWWLWISLFFQHSPPPPRHRSGPTHLDRCLHRWWTPSDQNPEEENENPEDE